eukprot:jgi/Ulvmu1/7293/UM035_0081.1
MACTFTSAKCTRPLVHPNGCRHLPAQWRSRDACRIVNAPSRKSSSRRTVATAATADVEDTKIRDLSGLMETLQEDSPNLFTDQGMDLSIYANDVDFKDPITDYSDIQGFDKNLKFLKSAFNPSYKMLDIRQISDTEVEARWSMGFDVLPIKNSPMGKYWQPRMEFTGTTIYGIDPETGLVNRHYDTWDSISQQKYFSVEGFGDVLSQIFNFQRTPDIPSPPFTTLKRKKQYAIRQYSPFVVATVPMSRSPGPEERTAAFRGLANYLFGGNQSKRKLQMTTPVFSSSDSMQFVLPVESTADAPSPSADSNVQVQQVSFHALCIMAVNVLCHRGMTPHLQPALYCNDVYALWSSVQTPFWRRDLDTCIDWLLWCINHILCVGRKERLVHVTNFSSMTAPYRCVMGNTPASSRHFQREGLTGRSNQQVAVSAYPHPSLTTALVTCLAAAVCMPYGSTLHNQDATHGQGCVLTTDRQQSIHTFAV